MTLGRFVIFFFATVVLGVLQLWILGLLLLTAIVPQSSVNLGKLLGDGGLFFFATTLTVSSALSLWDTRRPQIGDWDTVLTFIGGGVVLFIAVVVYAAVHSKSFGSEPLPFQSHLMPQLTCVAFALGYWFYVGFRTGWFKPVGVPDA